MDESIMLSSIFNMLAMAQKYVVAQELRHIDPVAMERLSRAVHYVYPEQEKGYTVEFTTWTLLVGAIKLGMAIERRKTDPEEVLYMTDMVL